MRKSEKQGIRFTQAGLKLKTYCPIHLHKSKKKRIFVIRTHIKACGR